MYKNLNSSLREIFNFFKNTSDTQEKERVADWLLDTALKAKGYNNCENHNVSGETYFYEKVLKKIKPELCVDVGANIGQNTTIILETTASSVIAFEPLVKPFELLKEIQKNYGDRLKLENIGVGAVDEILDIYFNDEYKDWCHASFSKAVQNVPYLNSKTIEKINVIKLDTYFSDKPSLIVDFIKIDTEGFEYEVITGAKKIIDTHKPKAIQLEFNWHQLFRGHTMFLFSEMLPEYELYQMLPNDLIKRDPKSPNSSIYQFSNFVFIRKDLLGKLI